MLVWGQLCGFSSPLLPLCGFWGLDSGHQACTSPFTNWAISWVPLWFLIQDMAYTSSWPWIYLPLRIGITGIYHHVYISWVVFQNWHNTLAQKDSFQNPAKNLDHFTKNGTWGPWSAVRMEGFLLNRLSWLSLLFRNKVSLCWPGWPRTLRLQWLASFLRLCTHNPYTMGPFHQDTGVG